MMKESRIGLVLIEDEPMSRKMITKRLKKNPFLNVFSFSTGEECYRSYNGNPDILITDYFLSDYSGTGVNGLDFSYLYPGVNKVLISGSSKNDLKSKAMKNGFIAYLYKDWDFNVKLAQVIDILVEDIRNPKRRIIQGKSRLVLSTIVFVVLVLVLLFLLGTTFYKFFW